MSGDSPGYLLQLGAIFHELVISVCKLCQQEKGTVLSGSLWIVQDLLHVGKLLLSIYQMSKAGFPSSTL